jgi:hypothetical protein
MKQHPLRHLPSGRRRLSRWGYAAVGLAGVVTVLLAAPALGNGRITIFGHSPNGVEIELGQLRQVVAIQTSNGEQAALWVGPSTAGGRCAVLRVAADASTSPPDTIRNNGGWCEGEPLRPQSAPITTTMNWLSRGDGGFDLVLAGRASPSVARIELQSASGATPLPLGGGYFVGELPTSAAAGELPTDGAPYAVVGYDHAGARVATVDLAELLASASPRS